MLIALLHGKMEVGNMVGRAATGSKAEKSRVEWGVWIPMSMTMTDRMDQEKAGLER